LREWLRGCVHYAKYGRLQIPLRAWQRDHGIRLHGRYARDFPLGLMTFLWQLFERWRPAPHHFCPAAGQLRETMKNHASLEREY
jgi:hypothetical protein